MAILDSEHQAQLSKVSSEASRGPISIQISGDTDFDYIINVANGAFKYEVNMVRASGKLTITVTHNFNTEGIYCITAEHPKPLLNADAVVCGGDFKYSYSTNGCGGTVEKFCTELKAVACGNGGHNLNVCSKYSTGGYVYDEDSMISTCQKRLTINSVADGESDLPITKVGIETGCNAKFTMVASDAECSLNIVTPLGMHKKKISYGKKCILQVRND
ncbi:uncharacterized protein LOC132166488 isoform X2 [Corylus avellana]|uniref:uncharacterized protein LOC132166488 isoform X2 n=1 Tax=Corylus avellana TaxID=13451 RepID=UPI00286ACA93|nr:uncharacterized protein LOC132166488 isoform X2 [Corylus avellana]